MNILSALASPRKGANDSHGGRDPKLKTTALTCSRSLYNVNQRAKWPSGIDLAPLKLVRLEKRSLQPTLYPLSFSALTRCVKV